MQRVETWRTRCRLPVAVDITASFVEIMLNDRRLEAFKGLLKAIYRRFRWFTWILRAIQPRFAADPELLRRGYLNPEALGRSDNELRLMYAMTVIRLVNGIVDRSREVRQSILQRAQGLEWPQFFVDLRHEASHQALPSLPVLRLAAQEAVWLLLERFWRPQLQQIEERGGPRGPMGSFGKWRDIGVIPDWGSEELGFEGDFASKASG